jgi:hypothetical protein
MLDSKNMYLDDTTADARARLTEGYRAMGPEKRLRRVFDLQRSLEILAAARIRAQHGDDVSERELRLRLASLRLARETMIRVFGWDPQVHGY